MSATATAGPDSMERTAPCPRCGSRSMPVRFDGVIWYSCLETTCAETDWRFWRFDGAAHKFVYRFPKRKSA